MKHVETVTGATEMLVVSRVAQRLAAGYYAFVVGQHFANPLSINSLPPSPAGGNPVGEIKRKDGTAHQLDLSYYLDLYREDFEIQGEVLKAWAKGALLTLGDQLERYKCFDRSPLLELAYHLRNGIAHGNRFNLTQAGLRRLANFPAHNRGAIVRSPLGTVYEIDPLISGPVLFDFMGAADVIDLLQSVEVHLGRLAGAQ